MTICTQCKEVKSASGYYKSQNSLKCKDCVKHNSRVYKDENKKRKKRTDAKYYKNNKSKFIECNKRFLTKHPNYIKDYAAKNAEIISIKNRKFSDKHVRELTDYYVNSVYRRVNKTNLDKSLIPIKREQLKIKRQIKNLKL